MKDHRKEFPFEYCAARFLRQWQKREKTLYAAISSSTPSEESIAEALAYFRVSRNFAKLKANTQNLGKIQGALVAVRGNEMLPSPSDKVMALSRRFNNEFGQLNLSAATKLLWLSYRSPYVVYDRRAVTALRREFQREFNSRDYADYASAWRAEYTLAEPEIANAIANLPTGRAFMPNTSLTDTELTDLAKDSWFMERVFDIFLWEVGGDGEPGG